MTAFSQAWTLLKQRGHAPLRQEYEDPQDYLSDDELAHEGLPVEAKDIPLEYDPRIEEQQGRAAEEIEAEGIDLPKYPYGEPSVRVSAVPPANVGRAGSIMGEGRPNLKELYFGNNTQTPAAKNEFITADDFMKPPVQKSFDEAWNILKFGYPAGYDMPEEVRARHNIQPTDPSEQVVDNVSVDVDGRNFEVPVNAGGLVPQSVNQTALDEMRRMEALLDKYYKRENNDQLKIRSDQLAQTPLGQALTAARAKEPQPLQFDQ